MGSPLTFATMDSLSPMELHPAKNRAQTETIASKAFFIKSSWICEREYKKNKTQTLSIL
jgi:hypothetical protein